MAKKATEKAEAPKPKPAEVVTTTTAGTRGER